MDKTSIYSDNQQKEEKSRLFFKDFILNQGWKFRDMPLDNDIDGAIEYFERDDSTGKLHTKAKFINIQLKATDNIDIKLSIIKYDCPTKFLHFCDICDTPVVLVLYSTTEKLAYCLFVQEYIYSVLDRDNKNWRNNLSGVTIKILSTNYIKEQVANFDFKTIFDKGISTIAQLRKIKNVQRYYQILNLEDNSHSLARRSSARILIDNSFAESKAAMREIIPKINEEIKINNYHRNKMIFNRFKKKDCDVVWLFFYNNINQLHHGLPFCQTQWINNRLDSRFRPLSMDSDEVISDIRIKWNDVEYFDDLVANNRMSKGDYLNYVNTLYSKYILLFDKIQQIQQNYQNKQIDFKAYKNKLRNLSSKLDKLFNLTNKGGFPPIECNDMDIKLTGAIQYLQNILYIVNDKDRNENNVYICNKMYLEGAQKDAQSFEYERNKIR